MACSRNWISEVESSVKDLVSDWRTDSMTTATTLVPMTTTAEPPNLSDLVERLGGVPLSRILSVPAPGTATEADVLEAERRYNRLYELVDGALVEKGMGFTESFLAGALIRILGNFVILRNLGVVSGADGTVRLFPGLVRIPDVAFTSWDRLPDRKLPKEPIPSLAPNLVIEVLSASNTGPEMERKRGEYFAAGVQVIWEVDPKTRTVDVYTTDGSVTRLSGVETIDGGAVLAGFALPLGELFAELDRHG
jgi:Uma2 family endonuclease